MKKLFLFIVFVLAGISLSYGQAEENGTVYIKHPAINVVKSLNESMVKGDSSALVALLTDDFKAYNGVSEKPDTKGQEKEVFARNAMRWFRSLDYFSISDFPGAYPDAIKYNKDNEDEEVWVQTWEMIKGVHSKTGVKITSPIHRLYKLTKDNKINTVISYSNESIFDEIRSSYSDRANGTLYDHHENINTLRNCMYAFEYGDMEKHLGYYDSDATFYDINVDIDETLKLEDIKTNRENFMKAFEIKSVEMIGYPDYLEYERNQGRSVLSWWVMHLVRKADDKEIKLFIHLNDDFDAEGKIVSEVLYYNGSLLEQD